jgi:septal ring factor EnvC (AmiA/AmiB activator)
MPYTLAEAAKAIGRNKTSVLRAIKAGKISAIRDEASGGWLVEPAELHRLYPAASSAAQAAHDAAARNGEAAREIALLREMLADKDRQIDSLSRRLESLDEERRTTLRQLTALLTDQRETQRRRWWRRFRKG